MKISIYIQSMPSSKGEMLWETEDFLPILSGVCRKQSAQAQAFPPCGEPCGC